MSFRRTRHPTHEEIRLWRHVMREASPMRPQEMKSQADNDNEQPAPPGAKPKPPTTPMAPAVKPKSKLSELIPGRVADIDKRTSERLTKGQMAIEGRLDLHGLTEAQAHAALIRFLTMSMSMGRRCVLIITGKGAEGKGVLRTALPKWLNAADLRPQILAVSESRQKDGGAGAFYVLLKRHRGDRK